MAVNWPRNKIVNAKTDEETLKHFSNMCKEQGLTMSTRIYNFMVKAVQIHIKRKG